MRIKLSILFLLISLSMINPKLKKFSFFIVLVIILAFLKYHHKNIRCLLIKSNNDFIEIDHQIFVSKNTPQVVIDSLQNLIEASNMELLVFWGELISKPTVIYCNTNAAYKKFGSSYTYAGCSLGKYIVISKQGLKKAVINHERCHAEVFSRMGEDYYMYYTKLPTWLDEGIAVQFDTENWYSRTDLENVLPLSIRDLKALDRPQKFYDKNLEQTKLNYIKSKAEIARFLRINSSKDLIKLLGKLKDRNSFYQEYATLARITN